MQHFVTPHTKAVWQINTWEKKGIIIFLVREINESVTVLANWDPFGLPS